MTRRSGLAAIPVQIAGALLAIACRIGTEQEGRDGGDFGRSRAASQAIVDDIGHSSAERGLQHFLIGGDGHRTSTAPLSSREFATEVMAKCD